jgi:hypothetical protein
MTEKKEVKSAPKAAAKKATTRKSALKATAIAINEVNVGYRAGDVYNALAAEEKALSVAEIAKAASISTEEVYLGIGWLLKEGKVKDEGNKVTLA